MLAVAYAARLLGVPASIFLPVDANAVKVDRIRQLGARIVEAGSNDLSAAIDAAYAYTARNEAAFFLHDASDPDVPLGTATIGAEIVAELPSVERVYVPMGDTALIRGVASAIKRTKPDVYLVGVVAANAPAYLLSWRDDRLIETTKADTIADGLAVRRPLPSNVAAVRALVDEVVAVTETEMMDAIRHLRSHEAIVAEPAAAAATAALLKDEERARVNVVLVTGRNIAPRVLSAL